MEQGLETLKQDPVNRHRADNLPPEGEYGDNEEKEIGQGYDKYMALGGILSQEEYRRVREHAVDGTFSNSMWSAQANIIGLTAGINLSPETVTIYGILRDELASPEKNSYRCLSDQKLLAEALLVVGDESSRDVLVKKHKNIFN